MRSFLLLAVLCACDSSAPVLGVPDADVGDVREGPGLLDAATLVMNPDPYVDGASIEVSVLSTRLQPGLAINAAACDEPGPCNFARGGFSMCADSTCIPLVPVGALLDGPVAMGFNPQVCVSPEDCAGRVLGCHGNDLEVVCAPAVPNRIESVTGQLRRRDGGLVFEASAVRLGAMPLEQTFEGTLLVDVSTRTE